MRVDLKELIHNSMEYSTFHAIPNIARSKRKSVKIIWLVILILSSVICGFLVIQTILQYLEFEVFNTFNVVYEAPTKFPAVSICNINAFVTEDAFEYISKLMSEFLRVMDTNAVQKYMIQVMSGNDDVPNEIKKSFGRSIDDFVLSCMFKGFECNSSDFIWYYDTYYGNCFRFNSGYDISGRKVDVKTTSQPGLVEGLQLLLYVGIPDNPLTFSTKVGAHVYVHNESVDMTPFEGIDLPPGMVSNIVVNREFIYKLPRPFNDCYDDLKDIDSYDSVLYKAIIKSNHSYRQKDCLRLCFQKLVIKECDCYDITNPRLFNARPCNRIDDLVCSQTFYHDFWNEDVLAKCGDLCPLECDSVTYTLSTSYSDMPSPSSVPMFAKVSKIANFFKGQNITYELIKRNFLYMSVYYEETKYSMIEEEESMSWIDMISNIGGTLGLFLGISFLSFIEILEFLLELFFLSHDRKGKKIFVATPNIQNTNVEIGKTKQSNITPLRSQANMIS